MDESERKSIKELSCKLAKMITERRQNEQKTNLIKAENSLLKSQLEDAEGKVQNMLSQEKKNKVDMDILKRQNEYKVYLADSTEKEKRQIEQEKQVVESELNDLRKINSIVETLAKVENKAQWANSIRRSTPIEEQAKVFYEAYRI